MLSSHKMYPATLQVSKTFYEERQGFFFGGGRGIGSKRPEKFGAPHAIGYSDSCHVALKSPSLAGEEARINNSGIDSPFQPSSKVVWKAFEDMVDRKLDFVRADAGRMQK